MEQSHIIQKHGWVWAFSLILFFFNSFLLPEGLTLTLIFFPVWMHAIYRTGKLRNYVLLLSPFALLAIFHLVGGADLKYYMISVSALAGLLAFLIVLYRYVNEKNVNWDLIFRDLLVLNFCMTILSIGFYFIPALKLQTWYMVPVSPGLPIVPRLKMFTSEASHYSFLFTPLIIYFITRKLFFEAKNNMPTMIMAFIPILLSLSMGVLSGLLISFLLLLIFYFRIIFSIKRNRLFFGFLVIAVSLGILYAFWRYPDNIVFLRIENILSGKDTSARGRTFEAFYLARKIIGQDHQWFGIGLGQLKLVGRGVILEFYKYNNIPQVTRIPNAIAETLVSFGFIGLSLRFFIEIYFFFRTRVYSNPFRFWLFLFVFIYQFTGSYLTNTSEYILWILAFSGIFSEFSLSNSSLKPQKTDSK